MSTLFVQSRDNVSKLLTTQLLPTNLFEVSWDGLEDDYYKFFCTQVNFPGAGIEIKKHEHLQTHMLKAYKHVDEITISYVEKADLSNYKMHEAWLALFFDRANLKYVSQEYKAGAASTNFTTQRERSCTIKIHPNSLSNIFPNHQQDPHELKLTGLIPKNLPTMSFSFEQGSYWRYDITYAVRTWELNVATIRTSPSFSAFTETDGASLRRSESPFLEANRSLDLNDNPADTQERTTTIPDPPVGAADETPPAQQRTSPPDPTIQALPPRPPATPPVVDSPRVRLVQPFDYSLVDGSTIRPPSPGPQLELVDGSVPRRPASPPPGPPAGFTE